MFPLGADINRTHLGLREAERYTKLLPAIFLRFSRPDLQRALRYPTSRDKALTLDGFNIMPLTLPTWSIDEDIYKGFWINQSLGRVRGATLTLDRQSGGLVIAFLALFIAATARSVWKITRFLIHCAESNPSAQDGIYHQRQAILRNQPLALNATLDLCQVGYVWRDRANRSPQRILPVILIASAISVASMIAGMFERCMFIHCCSLVLSGLLSSKIITHSNNEVLIIGRRCGVYENDPDFLVSTIEPIMLYQSQKSIDAFSYATQCYRSDTTKNELCDTLVIPELPFTSDRNATCPFSRAICKSEVGNILLDSGVIDSRTHLGLNQDPHFTLRHKTHCAPLRTIGFTEVRNISNSTHTRLVYLYGDRRGLDGNSTDFFSVDVKNEKAPFDGTTLGNYKVS